MKCLTALAVACASISSVTGIAQSPSREPLPGGTVSSSNQQGGVTAYWIGQVNYQQAPAPDPQARQLAGILEAYQARQMRQATRALATPAYIFLMTSGDGDSSASRNAPEIVTLFVEDDPDGEDEPICEVNGNTVTGAAARVSGTGRQTRSTIRMLTGADLPFVRPICDGLALPLSAIETYQVPSQPGARDDLTVFDFLSRGTGLLILVLMPDGLQGRSLENLLARSYWAGALTERYYRMPSSDEILGNPSTFRAMSNADSGEPIAMELPFVIDLPAGDGVQAYPSESRQEFGDRIGRLDAQWQAYLVRSGLTIQRRQRPLMIGNRTSTLLPRFSRQQLGTRQFWRAASDIMRTHQMVGCIAGRFLDDHAYRSRPNDDEAGRCARRETALPPQRE